jgi:signal transduction histidine kinase
VRKISAPFKPRARLLLELGNQLIKEEGIALFELVKNSYDADATEVVVDLRNIEDTDKGEIIVSDNGCGMDWDTIKNVWLEPGTDYRDEQVRKGQKTPKFHRTPMGQKGIGRFGAHKLGKKILLITRGKNQQEIVVEINWSDFEKEKYLQDVPVTIKERAPAMFTGSKSGTYIKISGLWNAWTRGMVRSIYRSLNSICSPFKSPSSFRTIFNMEDKDKQDWIEGLMSWKEAIGAKLYKATCTIDNDELSYVYEFIPWKTMTKVTGRKVKIPGRTDEKIKLTDGNKERICLEKYNIGRIHIDLYIYDLDTNLLALGINDKKGLKDFLKFNGGLRVYRDGVRVYDYGEPGNDWLDLGVRRVNVPTQKISNNLMIGAVSLSRDDSTDLIEKTNREGFVENKAVQEFREAILCALTHIEAERNKDKKRLRIAYTKTSYKEPVVDAIADLRTKVEKHKLTKELGGYIDRIENDYIDVREKLLSSAGAGLSLSIVIHEIEKIIKELMLTIQKKKAPAKIKNLAKRLAELVEGYAALVRKGGNSKLKAGDLIRQALFNVNYRLNVHNVKVFDGTDRQNDFTVKCSKRLILGAIMNIIDNSLYWLANKNPNQKMIYITPSEDLPEGPAIVIADNGPGVVDLLEDITQPFFTRKPDGMGLGLHITDEIMKAHKGFLKIIEKGDVKLPKGIDGAAFALIFPGEKND